jgi:hypothetical protein
MGRRWAVLLLVAASLGMAGCNSSTGTVRGKVYYGEALVKGGAVTFFCADGRGIRAGIRDDGSYTADGLPLGKAKICVDTSDLDPKRRQPYSPPPGKKVDLGRPSEPDPKLYVAISPKYAAVTTTDLTCEVTGGSQYYDIKMK